MTNSESDSQQANQSLYAIAIAGLTFGVISFIAVAVLAVCYISKIKNVERRYRELTDRQ